MKRFFLATALFVATLLSFASCSSRSAIEHPEWSRNAVIYEMNIRQYTPEGTIAAAERHLPRLDSLGVNLIWLMPIQTIGTVDRKGSLGSYYAVKDYYEVNPEFGTVDDVKRFIATAHSLGQKVILDWVANHTSRDAVWLTEHRDWYQLDSLGEAVRPHGWDDVAALDFDNRTMRRAMTDAMKYWIEEVGFDGLRCDVAWNVPTDFWEEALLPMRHADSELFFLAEAELPEHHPAGFDMSYAWELHHLFNDIAAGRKGAADLWAQLDKESETFPDGAMRMLFTSNHDENSWAGTEKERMGEADRTFAALTYILDGMPLIYSGQEVGFDRRLQFFEKDSIDWHDRGGYTALYTSLDALRRNHPALNSGSHNMVRLSTDKEIFAVRRSAGNDTVIGLFNLSNQPVEATIDIDSDARLADYFSGVPVESNQKFITNFEPWQYIILTDITR